MTSTVSNVYELKVTLKESGVWRRIQVPETYNFRDLHVAVQDAIDWHDAHLHEFTIRNPKSGKNDRIGKPYGGDNDVILGKAARMKDYFVSPKDKAVYLYDFGDGWEHDIVLEKILPAVEGVRYPLCIAGKRAGPPEDSGGVCGYKYLQDIMKNPQHPEYEDRMEWLEDMKGPNFDPEKFDPQDVVFSAPEDH